MDIWLSNMEKQEWEWQKFRESQSQLGGCESTSEFEHIRNWNELAHWTYIFNQLKSKRQDVCDYPLDSITLRTEKHNGIEFLVVHNPNRKGRPNAVVELGGHKAAECNLCGELNRGYNSKDNMLFNGEEFSDYLVCPNLWPIYRGHVVIINKNPKKDKIHPWDLEEMMRLYREHGYLVWHNKEGSALTIPHEHFQGILLRLFINYLSLKQMDSKSSTIENYPGVNFVFTGQDANKHASDAISRLDENKIYNEIICTDKIYVVPVKKYQGKGGYGGFEFALGYVELGDNEKVTGELIFNGLKNALFQHKEFDYRWAFGK